MLLSILIPTLPERAAMLKELVDEIQSQCKHITNLALGPIEILTDARPRGTVTTGQKRNDLLAKATGLYTWFIDDDDMILPHSLPAILVACHNGNADVICIDGFMTTDGNLATHTPFEMRLGHPYRAETRNGKEIYLRPPNHLCPIKRSIALQVPFANKNVQEDYDYCMRLASLGLCKTQHIIPTPVYHYRYISKK